MEIAVREGYESLAEVLREALEQSQSGKGRERHASAGEAFVDQQIVQLCEWMGSSQGAVFQACKKALESTRLDAEAGDRELLGAIVYLAAAVIVRRRAPDRQPEKQAQAERGSCGWISVEGHACKRLDNHDGFCLSPGGAVFRGGFCGGHPFLECGGVLCWKRITPEKNRHCVRPAGHEGECA